MTDPGGWVEGIGWVALLHDLPDRTEFVRDLGVKARYSTTMTEAQRAMMPNAPVIVTAWPGGSKPEPPVVPFDAHEAFAQALRDIDADPSVIAAHAASGPQRDLR